MEHEPTTIILGTTDAALVFREGEPQVEVAIPKADNDEEPVSNHVVIAVAIALRLKDEAWVKELMNWFEKKVDEVEVEQSIEDKRTIN